MNIRSKRLLILIGGVLVMLVVARLTVPWLYHKAYLRRYPEVSRPAGFRCRNTYWANLLSVPCAVIYDRGYRPTGPGHILAYPIDYTFLWLECELEDPSHEAVSEFEARLVQAGWVPDWKWTEGEAQSNEAVEYVETDTQGKPSSLAKYYRQGSCAVEGLWLIASVHQASDRAVLRVVGRRWNLTNR